MHLAASFSACILSNICNRDSSFDIESSILFVLACISACRMLYLVCTLSVIFLSILSNSFSIDFRYSFISFRDTSLSRWRSSRSVCIVVLNAWSCWSDDLIAGFIFLYSLVFLKPWATFGIYAIPLQDLFEQIIIINFMYSACS